MDSMMILIAVFAAVVTAIGAVLLVMKDYSATKAEERLDILTGQKTQEEVEEQRIIKQDMFKEGVGGLSSVIRRAMSRFGNLPLFFEQANSPIGLEVFAIISMVLAVIGVGVGIVVQAPVPLYPVIAITLGAFPMIWLMFRRKRRMAKFANHLPDALELIARALRSGHSLASGLQMVVQEMPDPISHEFAMAYEEQNLGIPIDQALKNVFKRMPNFDFKFFATAVSIQRQSGGDLAEILDKIGHIVRERFRIMGQVQALTGEGRISGIVLMALPVVLFFVMYYLNPDYIMLLFTEELGRKMIAVTLFLQLLGAFTIKKIIEIKV